MGRKLQNFRVFEQKDKSKKHPNIVTEVNDVQ